MFSARVAPFYINNYFAQRTSCWSCTWTEWTQDNIIQGYIESGRAEAWAQVYKALCFGENFLDLHRNAVLRKLFDKLRSLYLFSPSHPKFSSNYIKHLFWFGFFCKFQAGCNQHWIYRARTKITLVQWPLRNLISESETAQNDVWKMRCDDRQKRFILLWQLKWGVKSSHLSFLLSVLKTVRIYNPAFIRRAPANTSDPFFSCEGNALWRLQRCQFHRLL